VGDTPVTPRVSVILTVYKRTQYLSDALRSVLAQSFTDYEVIVADDSGTSLAESIVKAHENDPRIQYVPNRRTVGVAASLVMAAKRARAPLLSILNDDDVWETDLLAELVPPLEADPHRVLSAADHWIMDAPGVINRTKSDAWTQGFGRSELSCGDIPAASTFAVNGGPAINIASVFRKDAIDWDLIVPEVAGAYDYWIGCVLAATRRPIYYVPKRLARWREHSEMETRRRSHDKAENLVYIYSTLRARGWFDELDPVLTAKLADALFTVGRDKLHFNRAAEARRHFWNSFLLSGNLRAFVRAAVTFLPRQVRSPMQTRWAAMRAAGRSQGTEHRGVRELR
jgi:glycosyltransferase involved in cell wall biosynthesis